MARAGARPETVRKTQELRADMEVQRLLLLASRDSAESDLERMAVRLLTMADATAARIAMLTAANPAVAARPAEAIAVDLMSRPGDLAQCDRQSLLAVRARRHAPSDQTGNSPAVAISAPAARPARRAGHRPDAVDPSSLA